jgi:SagB-type dehydrogenase family enzyme
MSPMLLPARIEPVAVLPLTPSGRVDRAALTATASVSRPEHPRSTTDAGQDGALLERACALAARVLGVPEVSPTMNLLDLGATSVQLVRLAVHAEEELGIRVDVEELLRFPAVTILVSFADAGTEEVAEPPAAGRPDAGALVLDPVERMDFKATQPGLRRDLDPEPGIDLARPTGDRDRLTARRTHRVFGGAQVPKESLSRLVGVLRQFRAGVEPKYAYPSAGGLYPLQTYLSVADGRVAGVAGGVYYYHPVRHRLVSLSVGAAVDAGAHAWINRDAFRSSAFSLYLVADLDAITPLYGDRARDYVLIEAGAICQLLMTVAADVGLGVCPVGELDFAAIRDGFWLTEHHELLHTLLAGPVPDGDPEADQAAMLARVDRLDLAADREPR